jgi:Domain of unknown function (DUF4177)
MEAPMKLRRSFEDAVTSHAPSPVPGVRLAPQRFEYRCVIARSTLVGDRMNEDRLEAQINEIARQGWQLKAMTETEVKGRVGPGGTKGLMLTFERPV